LHNKRTSSGFGINPIAFTEIQAFFNLMQYFPEEWEVEMIERFDNIAIEVFAESSKSESKNKAKKK